MSIEPTKNVRVHRFRDYVAYSAKGETEYLTTATARELARLKRWYVYAFHSHGAA